MTSRLSAFVVPSERFTLSFDPTAAPSRPDERRASPVARAAVGLLTSAAVVLLAIMASTAQATPSARPATSPIGAGAGATSAAPAPVAIPSQPWSADDLYQAAAATCPGLPASVLAAIHHVETRGATQGGVSAAGALGPMQFLPATWASYGVDADGNGRADVENLVDAVYTAADYLCANGGDDPARLRDALWNYNHSWDYVEQVLAVAAT